MTNMSQVLDRNRAFAETDVRHNVPALPFIPRLNLYIVSCIDCRVDPAQILGIEMGEALVERNIGGRVTPAVIQDIAYASYLVETKAPAGPWFEVAVIHHTDRGSTLLADDDLRHGFAERIGVDERTLAETPVLDPARTVRTDVHRLLWAPEIPASVRVSVTSTTSEPASSPPSSTPRPASNRSINPPDTPAAPPTPRPHCPVGRPHCARGQAEPD